MKLLYLIFMLSKGMLPGDELPELNIEDIIVLDEQQLDYDKIINEEDINLIFWGDLFLEDRSEDTIQLLKSIRDKNE